KRTTRERTMPNRRSFFKTVASAGAGFAVVRGGMVHTGRSLAQTASSRREVMLAGRRVRVVDLHCHCIIPEAVEVVKGTPLAGSAGGGGGNNVLGLQRLQLMDQQGVDIQALRDRKSTRLNASH